MNQPGTSRFPILLAAITLVAVGCGLVAPDEHLVALYVAPERAPCVGVFEIEIACLQVREVPDRPWQLFYDDIEGFAWEPGFTWRIQVAWTEVSPVPADGSSRRYRLVRVLSRTPAG
jgi:hypothetical protein